MMDRSGSSTTTETPTVRSFYAKKGTYLISLNDKYDPIEIAEGEVLSYVDNPEQHREDHFSKYEKKERYLYLKDELNKKLAKVTLLKLVDAAAKGDIQAAEIIALGYYDGRFGERNLTKAKKWGSYAAKKGSKAAQELMGKL